MKKKTTKKTAKKATKKTAKKIAGTSARSASGSDMTWEETLVKGLGGYSTTTTTAVTGNNSEGSNPIAVAVARFNGDIVGLELELAKDRSDVLQVPDAPPVAEYLFEVDVKKTISRIGIRMEEVETKLTRQNSEIHALKLRLALMDRPGFFTRIFKSLFN